MVKWRFRACYSWCLTTPRWSWWSEALGELLEFVGALRRRSCTRFEARHSEDGERVFLVDTCSSWCKGEIPFVGAPTWTRGSVNSSIPREKIQSSLVHSHLLSSNLFSCFSALALCLFVETRTCLVSLLQSGEPLHVSVIFLVSWLC